MLGIVVMSRFGSGAMNPIIPSQTGAKLLQQLANDFEQRRWEQCCGSGSGGPKKTGSGIRIRNTGLEEYSLLLPILSGVVHMLNIMVQTKEMCTSFNVNMYTFLIRWIYLIIKICIIYWVIQTEKTLTIYWTSLDSTAARRKQSMLLLQLLLLLLILFSGSQEETPTVEHLQEVNLTGKKGVSQFIYATSYQQYFRGVRPPTRIPQVSAFEYNIKIISIKFIQLGNPSVYYNKVNKIKAFNKSNTNNNKTATQLPLLHG